MTDPANREQIIMGAWTVLVLVAWLCGAIFGLAVTGDGLMQFLTAALAGLAVVVLTVTLRVWMHEHPE